MRLATIAVGMAIIWPDAALARSRHHPLQPPVVAASPAPSRLLPYQPKEHDFTVGFPGTPDARFRLLMDGRERLYMDNEGDRLFMVTVTDYMFGAKSDQDAYDRRLLRFGENAGATLVSSRRLAWGGEQGCEGVFNTPQGNLVLVRMAVHHRRLYQAAFWGQGGAGPEEAETGRKFMESFDLTDQPAGNRP